MAKSSKATKNTAAQAPTTPAAGTDVPLALPVAAPVAAAPAGPNGKTTCPISRADFRLHAPSTVDVTINGRSFDAEAKEFSTGSLGWYLNGKTTVEVNGQKVSVQIGMNLTIVGSKELPPLQQ